MIEQESLSLLLMIDIVCKQTADELYSMIFVMDIYVNVI